MYGLYIYMYMYICKSKSDISYLKASWAFDILIHSRALLAAILCWLATL